MVKNMNGNINLKPRLAFLKSFNYKSYILKLSWYETKTRD